MGTVMMMENSVVHVDLAMNNGDSTIDGQGFNNQSYVAEKMIIQDGWNLLMDDKLVGELLLFAITFAWEPSNNDD